MSNISKKRNISTIIILAIVLLVPGFLYIGLNKVGSNQYLKLPVFGEKKLTGTVSRKMGREIPDTLFHQVQPLTFINQDGQDVHFLSNDTVISVVHLFSAVDSGLSKTLLSSLKPVVDRFMNIHKVQFYSISVNSDESPADLKNVFNKYAKDYADTWSIVKPIDSIFQYINKNLLVDAYRESDSSFVFSNNYLLIDSKGRIRGFYDINLNKETERLEDEIKVQLVEEARNNPLTIKQK